MDSELRALEAQIERLITVTRQLAEDKARLNRELSEVKSQFGNLQQRMREAREKVAAALDRLPPATASQPAA